LSDQLFAFEQHFIERRLATLQAKYAALGAFPHEPLVAQLRADDVTRCCTAARVLAEQADPRAILPLAAAYYEYSRDRYGYLVYRRPKVAALTVAIALWQLGEWEELANVLSAESGHIRASTLDALRCLDSAYVLPCLRRAVSHERLTYWVAQALAQLGDLQAVPVLIPLLQQSQVDTRAVVAEALGRLGDPQAIPALTAMAQTDDARTWWGQQASDAAAAAIQRIHQPFRH